MAYEKPVLCPSDGATCERLMTPKGERAASQCPECGRIYPFEKDKKKKARKKAGKVAVIE